MVVWLFKYLRDALYTERVMSLAKVIATVKLNHQRDRCSPRGDQGWMRSEHPFGGEADREGWIYIFTSFAMKIVAHDVASGVPRKSSSAECHVLMSAVKNKSPVNLPRLHNMHNT